MDRPQTYDTLREETGLVVSYIPHAEGGATVAVQEKAVSVCKLTFARERIDEARILYMEAIELLHARASAGQSSGVVRSALGTLFALFRGETVPEEREPVGSPRGTRGDWEPNPGKSLEIAVRGKRYLRLPIKTRLITARDTDMLALIREYATPRFKEGDVLYISEKALTITQGRVVDMSTIHPTWFARFLARHVGNQYGTEHFRGFGHGTGLAMQLFIEEAGYPRIMLAAALAALTRPVGIHGMFYRVSGKRAKSIDCPMSFLILAYAHSVKLAPQDPDGVAKKIRDATGHDTVILDANYRGAFSLGKSTHAISEAFIGELFRDNPLGQSDEMTPFCIVRKA